MGWDGMAALLAVVGCIMWVYVHVLLVVVYFTAYQVGTSIM